MTAATSTNPTSPAAKSVVASSLLTENGHYSWTPEILSRLSDALEIILSDSEQTIAESTISTTSLAAWVAENPSETLEVASASGSLFLQNNWTGPPCPAETTLHIFRERALRFLGESGDSVYKLCRVPEHLVLAIVLLEQLIRSGVCNARIQFELLKAYWMRQGVLDEKSAVLHGKMFSLLEKGNFGEGAGDASVLEHILLALNISIFYCDFTKGNQLLAEAKTHCKFSPLLTGILGKRTRFQDQEYSQLVVELQNFQSAPAALLPGISSSKESFPTNVALDDDTLLNETHLSKELPQFFIADHEAAVLLVEGLITHKKRARTGLEDEELLAFIKLVLHSSPCYAVRACALFHRSKLEGDKSRKTVRAMQQLETLMASFENSNLPPADRRPFALAVSSPPFWQVQETLGFLLLQNGLVKEAVNIFTALELWEDVVECYQRIGQKVKAEDLILKELAKMETPSMWCRLGDIRQDVACYDKAWELSKHRSARSRRDLGRLLLTRQDYAAAAAALRQGLDVNAIDAGAWFSLGYCQMKIGEFGQAEMSFRRCVNLDPENSLAWNNLGSIALRSQDYPKAYRILQESIKADYDNWNVWDNYQNACQKVKDFEEEIKACYRLLELRGKVNVDSLGLLVAAVVEGLTDIRGASALRLLPKVKELFGAMAAKLADNSKLWFLYAKLNMAELGEQNSNRKDLLLTIVQKLQRAFRYATKEKDWEKEEISLVNVLSIAKELGTHQMLLVQAESDDAEQRSVRSSCRLMLDSVITKVEKSCSDFVTGHLLLTEDSAKIFDEIRLMKSGL